MSVKHFLCDILLLSSSSSNAQYFHTIGHNYTKLTLW